MSYKMSLVDEIYAKWKASPYPIPQYPLVRIEGGYLIVIDDSGTIYRFMDTNGHIYSAVNHYCSVDKEGYYVCSNINAILCHPSTPEDHFVEEEILPLFIE